MGKQAKGEIMATLRYKLSQPINDERTAFQNASVNVWIDLVQSLQSSSALALATYLVYRWLTSAQTRTEYMVQLDAAKRPVTLI